MTDCSAIPTILDGLKVIVDAGVPDGTETFDGPFDSVPSGDFVCVGWSPFDDTAGSSTADYVNTARGRNEEFTVPIYCSTYGGDQTYKALRDRAKALGDIVAASLVTTPNVASIVGWGGVRGTQWYQQQSDNGPTVGLVLHVQGTARI